MSTFSNYTGTIKYNPIVVLAIFLFIFQPPLLPINFINIIGIISLIYYVISSVKEGSIVFTRNESIVILFMFVMLVYLLFVVTIINSGNLYSCFGPLRYVFEIVPFGICLSKYLKSNNYSSLDFIMMCIWAAGLQVVLGIATFLIPRLHHTFAGLLYKQGYGEVVLSLVDNRLYGLADGLTFATPLLLAVFSVLLIGFRNKIINLVAAALYFFVAIINARSAIIVLLIGTVLLIIKRGYGLKKKVAYTITIIAITFLIFKMMFPIIEKYSPITYQWITTGFEELKLLSQGDSVGYFNYLFNGDRWILPKSITRIIFGTGIGTMHGLSNYGLIIQSDIGYINDIWFGGIVYVIIEYSITFFMLFKIYKSNDRFVQTAALLMMLLMPVLNVKGLAFSINQLTLFIYLLFIVNCRDLQKRGVKIE